MGKYLVIWKMVNARLPIDRKERAAGLGPLVSMVKQDIEKGKIKDWGNFVGEARGYNIFEGTEIELMNHVQRAVPFADFEVHPIATIGQVEEMLKTLSS